MSLEEMDELYNKAQNSLAHLTSKFMRSRLSKKERIDFLHNLEEEPSIYILNRINKIALDNEDYETCEAIKIYANEKDILIE